MNVKAIIKLLLLLIGMMPTMVTFANTENRVALVIGNGKYQNVPSLPNAKNDARLIKESLEKVNFEVVYIEDASAANMEKKVKLFSDKLKASDVGLFYYAGHAIQYEGGNYLIPTDLPEGSDEVSAKYDAINVDMIVERMEKSENPTNIIILDSCRDNPFQSRSRSMTRGLATINSRANGMYIAYSTSPGDVATDGDGNNSPYTKALSEYITQPGITIHDVFTYVKRDVSMITNGNQRPWTSDSLLGSFYFSGETSSQESEIEKLKRELEQARQLAEQAQLEKTQNEQAQAEQQSPQTTQQQDEVSTPDTSVAIVNKRAEQQNIINKMNKRCLGLFNRKQTREVKKAIGCYRDVLSQFPGQRGAINGLARIRAYYEDKIAKEIEAEKYRNAGKSISVLEDIDLRKAKEFEQLIKQKRKSKKTKIKIIGAF